MNDSTISRTDLWRYSVLAVPVAFAGFPLYVLAPDYYATAHGVPLSLLGVLLLGLRLFDVVIDPLIGHFSDQYRESSALFMGIASILLCAGIYGLFNLSPLNPVLWFCICIATAVTGYSVLSINLNALGGLWTNNSASQTRITTLREACGLIGLIIAVTLPGLLKHCFSERQAYIYFCVLLIAFMTIAWLAFWPWLSKHLILAKVDKKFSSSLLTGVKSISRHTWHFLGVYGLSMLASSIPAVLVIFFVRDLLHAENLTGLFLLSYFLSGACAMPLWKNASARFGTYYSWLLAMLVAVASFVWAFFLKAGDSWQYAAICVSSGIALGADLALPPAILANHIHKGRSEDYASVQYALLAIAAKLGLALASAIVLPLLGIAGFKPAASNGDSALLFLSAVYALIPCIIKLSAALLLWLITRNLKKGATYENQQINSTSWSSHHA